MSPEWVEKFLEGVRTEGGEELTPPRLENDDITLDDDLFDDPEQFLKTVLAEGLPVIRDEVCHKHGPFARRGWIWRNWLIWKGSDPGYGNRYSKDAGCCGCEVEDAETKSVLVARNPDFIEDILVREFKLRGAMICDTHGAFVFKADLSERSMEYQQRFGRRYEVWGEGCPICDYDFHDEIDVSRCLDLSVDEWSRGGEAIMAALHYARGWMDSHVYVEALQHTVIPHVREWQEEHPVVEEPRLPNSLVEA
jgi:hypothetical protein